MKIKYEFVTGEVVEVEVEGEIGDMLIEIEKGDYNSNRKETRRHNSIEDMQEQGVQFQDEGLDIATIIEEKDLSETLRKSLNYLLPEQRELLNKVFYERQTIIQVARSEGVGESAIRDRLKRIYKKLKKILN